MVWFIMCSGQIKMIFYHHHQRPSIEEEGKFSNLCFTTTPMSFIVSIKSPTRMKQNDDNANFSSYLFMTINRPLNLLQLKAVLLFYCYEQLTLLFILNNEHYFYKVPTSTIISHVKDLVEFFFFTERSKVQCKILFYKA